MRTNRRQVAAEQYLSSFVGELKGLSQRMVRIHLVTIAAITALVLWGGYAILVAPYWLPANTKSVHSLDRLEVVGTDAKYRVVDLPFQTIPGVGREEITTLVGLATLPTEPILHSALYIPTHYNRLSVVLNGTGLLAVKRTGDNPLQMWRRSSLFLIPAGLLKAGENSLKIVLHQESKQLFDLSQIYLGPRQELQSLYKRNTFVSQAILWIVFFGAIWASVSAVVLLYVAARRFLLAAITITLLVALQSLLQLSHSSWLTPSLHVFLWFSNGFLIAISSLIVVSHHWFARNVYRSIVAPLVLFASAGAFFVFIGLGDPILISWWTTALLLILTVLVVTGLLLSAAQSIYREEARTLNPFLLQVVHSRIVIIVVSWIVILSLFGFIGQIPMVLINTVFVMLCLNASIIALISAVARTLALRDLRENLQLKVQQQERHLCLLNHNHLEAMRWSIMGQSAQTLVEEIKSPLFRMVKDLDIVRLDSNYENYKKQWLRLSNCTNRCIEHVRVIETLVTESDIQTTSFRMGTFVSQCMKRLQESYVFDWHLQSEIRGWIEADEHYVFSVIESIVDNAHHSALAAGHRLKLRLHLSVVDNYLRLSIQDNGTGVDNFEDVFKPFHTSKAFGLGLGVNLAQKHLNEMGGYLTLEPCDYGAKFCLHLPKGTVL